MQRVLSEADGVGSVVMCGSCDEVHLTVGRASFRLPRDMFDAVARMMAQAAERLSAPEVSRFSITFEDGVPNFAPVREG